MCEWHMRSATRARVRPGSFPRWARGAVRTENAVSMTMCMWPYLSGRVCSMWRPCYFLLPCYKACYYHVILCMFIRVMTDDYQQPQYKCATVHNHKPGDGQNTKGKAQRRLAFTDMGRWHVHACFQRS